MNRFNKKFLSRAIKLAEESVDKCTGGPFGTVIVRNDTIIAEGTNTVTTSNDPTAHAEIVAIREACEKLNTFQLDDCQIYCSCEPCPMCLGAIYWARLSALYFAASKTDAQNAGFDDSFIYHEITLPLSKRKIYSRQYKIVNANIPFRKWSESENKIPY